MRLGFTVVLLVVAAGWSCPAAADSVTTATGYRLQYEVRRGSDPVALIFMHGKNGTNSTPAIKAFAERISSAGITIYLPLMPWSSAWDGTHQDATAAIDALVGIAAKDGKKVVVGGQSMGAMFSVVYRASDPPPAVIGKMLTSPGGLLDMLPPTAPVVKAIAPSVEKAKALEAAGKGKEKTRFAGGNVVGEKNVEESYVTTPEVFLSFHDTARFPSVRAALGMATLPVFWATGTRDPVSNVKRSTFNMMPTNPASLYLEPDADHNSVMSVVLPAAIEWLKARAAPAKS
jgi:pimeloyl-ACP methyl ester carboxylesterase